MAEFPITYSLSTDFTSSGGTINVDTFQFQLEDAGPYTVNFVGVRVDGDAVNVIFDAATSAGDKTITDGVVAAHTGVATPSFVSRRMHITTVAPTVNDDESKGSDFEVGSQWLDTVAGKQYVLIDPTAGAAVWVTPGTSASIFSSAAFGTASATFVDAFAGAVVNPPRDGDYEVMFEGSVSNSTNGGEGEIAIGKNSTTVAVADTERASQGPGGAAHSSVSTVRLNGLVTTDAISGLARKASGGGDIDLSNRRLVITRIG